MDLRTKAEAFRALHHGGRILVLVNAWDVPSARIVEEAGAAAIATTSAGVANALGYADGQRIPREVMIDAVRRIVRAVQVPVSADVEAGYGPSPDDVGETARLLLDAGAVGLNFEDGSGDPAAPLVAVERQVERIGAIRRAADAAGVPLTINARTDVFLDAVGAPATRFDEAVRRANAYLGAGADCAFVPGVAAADVIAELVRAVRGPLNILAGPGAPPIAELQRLGVARVSTGSAFARACYARARAVARDVLTSGSWEALLADAIPYREMNELAGRRGSSPSAQAED
ncbi:MAG: isocitrate lyase/phosphoenolpyruvate mutase family protein [Acidobacteria bacterium]|nr:isocitrate lyase/phosphoenolpyruvate mutase family protein [Acidobacteriota bacterium]